MTPTPDSTTPAREAVPYADMETMAEIARVVAEWRDGPGLSGPALAKVRALSASPAAGGVDAVARIADFLKERDDGVLPEEIDDTERQASAEEIIRLASLSPAPTSGSEAGGEAGQSECGFPFCSCAKRGVCAHAKEDQING